MPPACSSEACDISPIRVLTLFDRRKNSDDCFCCRPSVLRPDLSACHRRADQCADVFFCVGAALRKGAHFLGRDEEAAALDAGAGCLEISKYLADEGWPVA